jgi:hypothetical protein
MQPEIAWPCHGGAPLVWNEVMASESSEGFLSVPGVVRSPPQLSHSEVSRRGGQAKSAAASIDDEMRRI